jgi:hypothetical protein
VPAQADDKFLNDKCMVCWDHYHWEHISIRILPCGHIFGRECIIAMTKAATGANCPVCFTPLFCPSPEQLLYAMSPRYRKSRLSSPGPCCWGLCTLEYWD